MRHQDEMVLCDAWDGGFNLYLPAVEIVKGDIDAAVTELKKKDLLRDIDHPDQKLQFTAFQTNPARIQTPAEETCYKPLVDICKVLGELRLGSGREASCELVQDSDSFSMAETDADFKMDAYLKLRRSTMPASDPPPTKMPIADVAVPSEYQTYEWDFVDNREQLFDAVTFCVNNDPRRMHIYGITIEGSKMTVWYFSRSHSAKSPQLDFTKDPCMFVRVMLSFLFATEDELGYDPTVQRHLDSGLNSGDKALCYVYKVGDSSEDQAKKPERYFKTQGAIFEHRSLCAAGPATRVWKVVEVGSFDDLQPLNGSTMVLKDVWPDSDSKTEGQNLDAIFERLQEIAAGLLNEGDKERGIFEGLSKKSKKSLKKCLKKRSWGQYFLTKVCDWQGCESKVPPAAQSDPTLFDPPTSTITPSSNPHFDRTRTTTHQATNPIPNRLPPHYFPKRQYRVVFEEVCEALHDVTHLHDVATALLDSVFALQLMFLAGWVHRDISSGNIYAYRFQKNGTDKVRGILADLEYAKRFEPERADGSSDPKAGTSFFMAVEIQRQIHIYTPYASWRMPSRENKDLDNNEEEAEAEEAEEEEVPEKEESEEEESEEEGSEGESSEEESSEEEASKSNLKKEKAPKSHPKYSIGVIHNFEHDMESIFWLLLWTLLTRFPPKRTAKAEQQFLYAVSTIFHHASVCLSQRELVFTRCGYLKPFLKQWLNPELQPLVADLIRLQTVLMVAYHKRKLNFNDLASYARLYRSVSKTLKSCRTLAKELGPGSSMQGPTPGSLVHRPAQVKRGHSKVDVGRGDGNKSSSKVGRVDGSTDAASSRTLHQQNPETSEHEESGQSAKTG